MINGFDISQYFYRDCSSINIFKKYNRSIYNTKNHVKVNYTPNSSSVDKKLYN